MDSRVVRTVRVLCPPRNIKAADAASSGVFTSKTWAYDIVSTAQQLPLRLPTRPDFL
jgi:hypothetical protein